MADNSKGELIKKKNEEHQKKKLVIKKIVIKKPLKKESSVEEEVIEKKEKVTENLQNENKTPNVNEVKKEIKSETNKPFTPNSNFTDNKFKKYPNNFNNNNTNTNNSNFNRPYDPNRPPINRPYDPNRPPQNRPYDPNRPPQNRPYDPNRPQFNRPYDPNRPPINRPYDPNRPPANKFGQNKPPFNKFGQNKPPFNKFGQNKPPFNKDKKYTPGQKPIKKTGEGLGLISKNEKDRERKKVVKKVDSYHRKDEKREEIQKAFNLRKNKPVPKANPIPEKIDIIDIISISDLAKKMNLKANVIIRKLMELGTMVTINDKIDSDTATILCTEYNCKVNVVSLFDETIIEEEKDEEGDLEFRYPIVTVMGHVDHGKTKLLDAIRSTNVVAGESGGITQHIGAYCVTLSSGKKITFIDTPGHEAFTTMRARGANVTDIVILVVAADDGVMPQTIEAINHAKAAKVPIIVAINKIDKEGVNPDKIKQQLTDYDLLPEDWGGHTLYAHVSALKKQGIQELLDTILLQAEVMDLKASYKARARGFVLESKIDPGRGVVATILVLKGTLRIGDNFVAGVYYGKIRAMYNDKGEKIEVAYPSTPVEITGIEKAPKAGDPFNVTKTEKEAKLISAKRVELNKSEDAKSVKKITIKELLAQKAEGEQQELKVIIKADVQGSAEALKDSLEKLSNKEIKIVTISSGVGAINESDIMFAVASKAIVIGFHVRPNPKAQELAEKEKVEVKRYNIIYDVIEDIKASITGMIKPELIEEYLGNAEIKKVFKISKVGTIAGCIVTTGKIKRNSLIRLMRENVIIHSGKLSTLKRFKDDASEVLEGMECGIGIENYKDIKEGDIMEAYEIREIARKYEDIAIK